MMDGSQFESFDSLFAAGLDTEHEIVDTPALTALMHRTSGGFGLTEVMWVHGYPRIRSIIVTVMPLHSAEGWEMPGVVRELPVGFRDMASAEAFAAAFDKVIESYQAYDWFCVSADI